MNERFFDLLTGADWKRRISVTRQTLQDAMGKGVTEIIDAVSVPPVIMESMRQIDTFISNRRYTLAMDESYHIIEKEPDYIAAHMKIGEILVQLNRIEQAVNQFSKKLEMNVLLSLPELIKQQNKRKCCRKRTPLV